MAATVEVDETNGAAAGTITHNPANSNYGSIDAQALDPVANPITPGNNSYEKWQQWDVTAMGGSSAVKNLKYFASAGLTSGCTHGFGGHTTQGTYDSTKKTTYATPATTATNTPNAVPTSAPGTANIGIAGSLTGQLTATGKSDYVVSQVQTTGAATAGTSITITFRYDEIA